MAQKEQVDIKKKILIAKLILAIFVSLVQFMYLQVQNPYVYLMTNLSVILGYMFDVIAPAFKKGISVVKVCSWVCLVVYSLTVLFSFLAFVFKIDDIFDGLKDQFWHSFFYTKMPVISFFAVILQCGYILLLIFQEKSYE